LIILKRLIPLICFLVVLIISTEKAQAQGAREPIQFSGVVVGEDSTSGVPGVHIYVPKAGRGTTSNIYGYFTMPVLPGDSIVISAIGYQRQHYIIPKNRKDGFTVIVELNSDTTYLPEIEIFPYPSEEDFKAAILALQLPDEDEFNNMRKNLDPVLLAKIFENTPMSANMNHRYFMHQQTLAMTDKFGPRPNQLLNPFAWAQFIQSIKRGDFKKKK
jgi:hypothetical protein